MIGLFAIIAHYGTIIRYYCAYYCTYYCTYYGTWVPIIRYYSLLLFAIIRSYYSLLLFIIFPIILYYGRVSAPGKWECADSNS